MRLEGFTTLKRRSISNGANLLDRPLGETTDVMADSLRQGLPIMHADPSDITPSVALCFSKKM